MEQRRRAQLWVTVPGQLRSLKQATCPVERGQSGTVVGPERGFSAVLCRRHLHDHGRVLYYWAIQYSSHESRMTFGHLKGG